MMARSELAPPSNAIITDWGTGPEADWDTEEDGDTDSAGAESIRAPCSRCRESIAQEYMQHSCHGPNSTTPFSPGS
ncbi:hypothetical protein GOPIP_031_04010 [Gordonia polyisoprenivorans NBRC 16320 = JCM 10675]|nr:hypothetical protein GOPIP_031_04010 [Gordonia polyisoprenivorans NBRC 16320 = JCM 10675]